MMNNQRTYLIINQNHDNVIEKYCGLMQGSMLSPLLFNIYINDLAVKLNEEFADSSYFYADEEVLKSIYPSSMERLLAMCSKWADENNMQFNSRKCAILGSNLSFKIQNSDIPNLSSYRYLGIPFTKDGINFTEFTKEILNLQIRLHKSIAPIGPLLHPRSRLTIFKVFIRSQYEYCLNILSSWLENTSKRDLLKQLEDNHNLFLQWITQSSRNMPAINKSITGLGSAKYRMDCLTAYFAKSITFLDKENPFNELLASADATTVLKPNEIITLFKTQLVQKL
jgi:hypothetical protein